MQKTFKAIIYAAIFTLVFIMFFHPITAITQDLGRHLKTGEIILSTHNVPKINLFSYTYPNFPFINHHWLSEVIFYTVFKLAGFNGLLIMTVSIVIAAFLIILSYLAKGTDIAAVGIASVLYLGILFERTDIRPEIFSFLFLCLFTVILYKNQTRSTKLIFLLPLIELLWVNIHIYFIVGPAVIGLFLAADFIKNLKSGNLLNKSAISLTVVLLLTSLATLINPNGINGALFPFRVMQNYGYTIEENQNIFFIWNYFHKSTTLYFFIASLALLAVLAVNLKKTRIIDWFLGLFFISFGVYAERNIALFVFATFIPFAENLSSVIKKINLGKIKNYILLACVILLIIQMRSSIKARGIGFGVEKGALGGANFFLRQKIKGPIFNNFDIGSYLDYRFYPKLRVFVDGRPEAYPAIFFQNTYIPMQENEAIFTKIDKKYKFNAVFFSYTDQTPWAKTFLGNITKDKNWKIVYLDSYIIILVKNDNKNKNLIKIYGITEKTPELKKFNTYNTSSLIRLAYLFNLLNWKKQAINIDEKLILKHPHDCSAIYNLYSLLYQENNPSYFIYLAKLRMFCAGRL
ncbi:hypothetical protein M1615_00605 [Patescibacteria group bacterium]|nr:hypothetical protein [Patescibacteria group bacterium]MCL5010217.1 hypothetical protein [Patescibacteria group bacterium]